MRYWNRYQHKRNNIRASDFVGMYKYLKETFEAGYKAKNDDYKARIVKWNNEPMVVRVEKPTNIARARELGYKAKQGVVVVRVGVKKGKKKRVTPGGGRKPSRSGRFFSRQKSKQSIAEDKAKRKFINCEVLNSYFVGKTGQKEFFEVILLEKSHPSIQSNREYSGIISNTGRSFRGLTSSGKRHRGLMNKGFGAEKQRPSVRSATRKKY